MANYGETKVSIFHREIKINGYISLTTVSAVARAIRNMQRRNLDPIVVIIKNSRGGCASSGQMIFGILRNAVAPIYTIVERFAWSAAFYIFLAGEKRIIFRNAHLGPHSIAITHYKDVSRDILQLYRDMLYTNEFNQKLFATIHSVVAMQPEEIEKICVLKTIFSAQEALRVGFATDLASAKSFYKPRNQQNVSYKELCTTVLPKEPGSQVLEAPK